MVLRVFGQPSQLPLPKMTSMKITHEVNAATGHPVGRMQVVDRVNNMIYERIVERATGEEILRKEEPLTDHRGRGDAKADWQRRPR